MGLEIFKYQQQINQLLALGCQLPVLVNPDDMFACRFVSTKKDNQNHIPQYMSNPKRMLRDIGGNRATTSLLALSCFTTTEKAKIFFEALLKTNTRATISIGDSLSEGTITNFDGKVTKATANGHFDLYEFPECNLNKTFTLTQKLI